jgi:hypothetical protein
MRVYGTAKSANKKSDPLIGIALTLNFNTAASEEINFTQQTQNCESL